MSAVRPETLSLDWGEAEKAPADRKRWLGAWLLSREGEEGDYFYDGPGGRHTTHRVPAEAIGFRLRWYPSENEVSVNLELGPMASVVDDYFFAEQAGPELTLAVQELLPEQR